ncbi:hypothetical protein UFOVP413_26 [uncultured Caudovirales phage]|uniref:Uncharacterized protein n=1 Tax=uncultured Caudovirales phage TaxID=2100421 RepID=A0A6J5M4B5_9CAUD|nr:hypothetical protein UFOVP413_26 [uncultured Caudovirales phage]
MAKLIAPEATATAVATTTVYTVPPSKAARVKIAFKMQANASNPSTLRVNIGNLQIFSAVVDTNAFAGTFSTLENIDDGKLYSSLGVDPSAPASGSPAFLLAQLKTDYILAAGQTVTYTISNNAAQSMNFKVMGVEDDAV